MKHFANASFPPEMLSIMKHALEAAVSSLPDPVNSAHVQVIAETILAIGYDGLAPVELNELPVESGRGFHLAIVARPGRACLHKTRWCR